MNELTGSLSGISELHGVLSGVSELCGSLSIPESMGVPYKGEYEVVPTTGFQLLPTSECYLEEDILIHPIPYAEVSNPSGGYTATIGG